MSRKEKLLLLALVASAIAARVFFAWTGQWSTDPDRGIVSVMAMHMAEGRAWPQFFYGQGYMGSIEPFLSSLFVRAFGASGFTIALGTAIPAALLLIPIYLLARRMAGPIAGAVAAGFLVVGPDAFLAYMSSPRGGYAVILLLNAIVLLLAVRIAERAWRKEESGAADWIGLGLCGGLGWWTNPMIAPALVAAAAILIVALRGRILKPGIAYAALAFGAGAAPWLIWNATHGWESLSMGSSLGGFQHLHATGSLLVKRIWQGLDWGSAAHIRIRMFSGILTVVVALAAYTCWRRRSPSAPWAFAALLIYLILFSLSYALSTFAYIETLRYILPIYLPLAILFGVAAATFAQRHVAFVALPLVLLLAPQLKKRWEKRGPDPRRATVEAAPAWAENLRARGVDALFSGYQNHWLNFADRGILPVVELAGDRVPLLDRAGLLAEHPAFFTASGIADFVARTQATGTTLETKMGAVITELQPNSTPVRPLSTEVIESVTTLDGNPAPQLVDRNFDNLWRDDSQQDKPAPGVEIAFRHPVKIAGALIFSRERQLPIYIQLDMPAPDGTWTTLAPARAISGWYWSGPQPYFGDLYNHAETRCAPTEVTRLRVLCPPSPRRASYRFRISEIVFLEEDPSASVSTAHIRPDLAAIIAACRQHGVQRILASRWVSDRIGVQKLPDLTADFSSRLQRRTNDPTASPPREYTAITHLNQTALFSEPAFARDNRALLEATGHTVEALPLPGGEFLIITAAPADPVPLAWLGNLLLLDHLDAHL
ncbi:MAG: glycosyltransferase family 39 protein [Kiritimatiellae bacterium]|nr:glycosyltransferase family 39 protein [Kiritimatiellia bacterium]